jgi:wyosine [tRNA(Phe)-imidazoG37] synthetase (radical SAM superfamily)
MSVNINETLDKMVKEKQMTYMEAILKYTNDVDCEIEMVAKMLNKQIKDKIEAEAYELNMMKDRSSKLPL